MEGQFMARKITMGVVLSLVLLTPKLFAQMSHEEEVVRNAYAKLSFMCESGLVYDAAGDTMRNRIASGTAAINTLRAEFCPVFSLSAFQTGPIAEIANEPLSRFITLPTQHEQVLNGTKRGMSYNFIGNETGWMGVEFKWVDSTQNGFNGYPYAEDFTVAKAIAQRELQWSDQKNPVFTRYAAYTVSATLQGKSTVPHRAIFFFGRDGSKEVVNPEDPIGDKGNLYHIQDESAYPGAFLSSDWRDFPVVAAWVRSHEMPSASCSAVAARTLCCSQGRCGISQADLIRDLAAPLPPAKSRGGQ